VAGLSAGAMRSDFEVRFAPMGAIRRGIPR